MYSQLSPCVRTPHYYGQELKSRGIRITEHFSRYYGLPLLRTPNRGPGGVRYNESWLYVGFKQSNTRQTNDPYTN